MAIIRAKDGQVHITQVRRFEMWSEKRGYNILVYSEGEGFTAVLTSDKPRALSFHPNQFVTNLEGNVFEGKAASEVLAIATLAHNIQGKQYKHIAFDEDDGYTADF